MTLATNKEAFQQTYVTNLHTLFVAVDQSQYSARLSQTQTFLQDKQEAPLLII